MNGFGLPGNNKWKDLSSAQRGNYVSGVGTGALQLASQVAGNLQSNQAELDSIIVPEVTSSNKAGLAGMIGDFEPFSYKKESALAKGLSGAASGAGAGIVAGPWGAAAGAVVGAVTGVLGAASRNKRGVKEMNQKNLDMSENFYRENAKLTSQGITDSLLNYAAFGGKLSTNGGTFSNNVTEFNSGNRHEQNPYGGIMQGIGANGQPNVVEQGEVKYKDYIFSNRLNINPALNRANKLPAKFDNKSFAHAAKLISKESKERPFDIISNTTKDTMLGSLRQAQDSQKEIIEMEEDFNAATSAAKMQGRVYAKGGQLYLHNSLLKGNTVQGKNSFSIGGDIGLFAPAFANLGTMIGAIGSKPEVLNIPRIQQGQRLNEIFPYNPIDPNLLGSRISAQAGATRRGIMDYSGGNRGAAMAGLLAADQSYIGATGDAFLKSTEMNRNQLLQNRQLSNQARQYNNDLGFREQTANQQSYLQEWDMNARNRAARRNAISSGLQAIAGNVGDMTKYLGDREMISNTFGYTDKGKYIAQLNDNKTGSLDILNSDYTKSLLNLKLDKTKLGDFTKYK